VTLFSFSFSFLDIRTVTVCISLREHFWAFSSTTTLIPIVCLRSFYTGMRRHWLSLRRINLMIGNTRSGGVRNGLNRDSSCLDTSS
jgi:hypothetical protein